MVTRYKAGGLRIDDKALLSARRLSAPDNFTVPKWLDNRPYCLPANDQGNSSSCAGQATAGYAEVLDWKTSHVAKQLNGFKIYDKAKELDDDGTDGTSLTQAIKAAKALGLLRSNLGVRVVSTKKQVQYAIHTHQVVIAGFMITASWNYAGKDGWVPEEHKEAIGGHAVLCCWYSEEDSKHKGGIGFQNSWGPKWGANGFGRISWNAFNEQFLYAAVLE